MRYLIMFCFLLLPFIIVADDDYPLGVEIPVAGLGLNNAEFTQAANATLKRYGWEYASKSDTHIAATVRGRTPLDVKYVDGKKVTITYREEYSEHKFYRRLRLLRKHVTIGLSDCRSKGYSALDVATKARRNMVNALAQSNWVIDKTDESGMVAKSVGNGRIEIQVSYDGTHTMKRWDEIEEEYTEPGSDRYIQKVNTVLNDLRARCGR